MAQSVAEALEASRQRFKQKVKADLRGPYEAKKLGIEYYVKDALNIREVNELEAIRRKSKSNPYEAMVDTLMVRFLDAKGKPIFDKGQRRALLEEISADDVVDAFSGAVWNTDEGKAEAEADDKAVGDAVKN